MPVTSLTTAPASAVLRAPTGIWSSGAPAVPLRPSEPAQAFDGQTADITISTRRVATPLLIAQFMRSIGRPPLEVLQTFLFHEHQQAYDRGPCSGNVHVDEVH